jgi:hypothetical protein
MVKGGREKKHVLINERLNDARVCGRGTTPELLPLGKMMRASSGNRCKRCITLKRGRRGDSDINNSILIDRERGRVLLV